MRLAPARSLAAPLAVLAALALTSALGACGSDKDKKYDKYKATPGAASGSAPAAEAPRPAAPAPAPAPAPPPKAEDGAAPAAADRPPGGALPNVCNEYRVAIQRLSQCGDALPKETQEALKSQFQNQWAGWEKLPDKDRSTLAAICKSSVESLKAVASKPCGW
jgi:hypothetical protein